MWSRLCRRFVLLLPIIGALALSACNDDGRSLAPTSSQVPVTAPPTAPADDDVDALRLSSPAFADGDLLDPDHTCDGRNVSPPLVISGVPDRISELAVVVVDRDADDFVHWVVAAIPGDVRRIETGSVPPDAVVATTDTGVAAWDGPCPPPGDDPHRYEFTVHAMLQPVDLPAGLSGRETIDAVEAASVDSASLTAFYASPASG